MPHGIVILLYGASLGCWSFTIYTLWKNRRGKPERNPVEVVFGLLVGYMGLTIFVGTFLEHATDMPYQTVATIKWVMFYPLAIAFFLGLFIIGKELRREKEESTEEEIANKDIQP